MVTKIVISNHKEVQH